MIPDVVAETDVGGLTVLQLRLLAAVAAYPKGRAPSGELPDALGVTKSAISKAVEGLVSDGLLVRIDDAADRRRLTLQVTETGGEKVRRFASALARSVARSHRARRSPGSDHHAE